jgi:hypothetical protein
MSFFTNKKYTAQGERVTTDGTNTFPYTMHFFFMEDGNMIGGKIDWDAMTTAGGKNLDAQSAPITGTWAEDGTISFENDWTNWDNEVRRIKFEGKVDCETKTLSGSYSSEDSDTCAGDFEVTLVDA